MLCPLNAKYNEKIAYYAALFRNDVEMWVSKEITSINWSIRRTAVTFLGTWLFMIHVTTKRRKKKKRPDSSKSEYSDRCTIIMRRITAQKCGRTQSEHFRNSINYSEWTHHQCERMKRQRKEQKKTISNVD